MSLFTCLGRYFSHTRIVLFNEQTLDRIHDRLHLSDNIVDAPLRCDRWIASSLLQKSIRRGEVELARRAASTLHAFDRNAIWRRLIVIACEDVGVGDIDALLETFLAAASTDLLLSPARVGRVGPSAALPPPGLWSLIPSRARVSRVGNVRSPTRYQAGA